MNRMLAAVSALALVAVAAPAFAADNAVTINGSVQAKCVVAGGTGAFALTTDLADADGRLNTAFLSQVVAGMNAQGISAWCSGNNNTLVLTRTALKTGNGALNNNFAQAVIYDLAVNIADATRGDSVSPLEGTSDGPANGPGIGLGGGIPLSNFGGAANSAVTFVAEASQTPSAVVNSAPADGATSAFTSTSNRLVAGTYTGTVTLTLGAGNI